MAVQGCILSLGRQLWRVFALTLGVVDETAPLGKLKTPIVVKKQRKFLRDRQDYQEMLRDTKSVCYIRHVRAAVWAWLVTYLQQRFLKELSHENE
ncbi:MAG: hypothetical protein OES46_18870 [Gammaproteobacteria bacterium]|nr:hypothetical protein [Gammaproteobacteria bacterium]